MNSSESSAIVSVVSVSSIWEYFEKCDNEGKAKCLLCNKLFSCSTSHNLKHHLKCIHSNEIDVDTIMIGRPRKVKRKEGYPTRDLIRKTFSKVEGDKLAMCNQCQKIFSYKSTICNLRHHFKKVHHEEYLKITGMVDDVDTADEDTYHEVTEEDEGGDDVSFLKFEHREAKKRRKKDGDNEVNIDDVYTEVVYLEDEESKPSITKYKTNNNSKRKHLLKTRAVSISDSSVEDLNYSAKKIMEQNELNKFGQYIACLLASLPKPICTKLQMNIVNTIMEEKLKIESQNENKNISMNLLDSEVTQDPINRTLTCS